MKRPRHIAEEDPAITQGKERSKIVKQLVTLQSDLGNAVNSENSTMEAKIRFDIAITEVKIAELDMQAATSAEAKRSAVLNLRRAEFARRKAEHYQKVASLKKNLVETEKELSNPHPLIAEHACNTFTSLSKEFKDLKWDEAAQMARIAERYPDPTMPVLYTSFYTFDDF